MRPDRESAQRPRVMMPRRATDVHKCYIPQLVLASRQRRDDRQSATIGKVAAIAQANDSALASAAGNGCRVARHDHVLNTP